jgi:hypothetical protein
MYSRMIRVQVIDDGRYKFFKDGDVKHIDEG